MIADPSDDEEQRQQMTMDAEIALQTLTNRDNPNDKVWIDQTRETITSANGTTLKGRKLLIEFNELVRRELIELRAFKRERLDHNYSRNFHDPRFIPCKGSAAQS